jgi:putative oxidoreductase
MEKYVNLAGRILLAHIFLLAGLNKISGYSGTQGYMEAMGVPGVLLPLVAAYALAVFCAVSALIFHNNLGDQMQMIMFMKNWAMAGGLLVLAANGAGAFSLDNRQKA